MLSSITGPVSTLAVLHTGMLVSAEEFAYTAIVTLLS